MKSSTSSLPDRLNTRLARLLALGTLTSCALIMIGMLSSALGLSRDWAARIWSRPELIFLIALPTTRVATMAVWFLRNGDRQFALVAACVLAIIVASTLLGIRAD